MLDLVVEGNAYLDGKINKCCIGIEKGKIVAMKKILKGDLQLDFGDKLILPAGIDSHVHFREPGFTNKENFASGTMSAAFGGIGCVFDMPNTKPPIISKDSLMEKLEIVSKKAYVDYGLYSSISSKTNIPAMAEVCSAFKLYLGETTGKLGFPKNISLAFALDQINKTNRIPAIHAEAETVLRKYKDLVKPIKTLHDYLLSRPNSAEVRAVERILKIVDGWTASEKNTAVSEKNPKEMNTKNQTDTGGTNLSVHHHVHICHVSTAEVVGFLRNRQGMMAKSTEPQQINNPSAQPTLTQPALTQPTRSNSMLLSSEVTPHHLILNKNSELGAFGKVNPPLRTPEDQAALWSGFRDGIIQILASDHAPHTVDEKTQEFDSAPAGIPGVETMLPMMLSFHKHHKITLERLVNAISETPAKIFNLPKGRLATGYDGDLVVIDFYNERDIKIENLHSKCGWSPYENMPAIFPMLTVVRGKIIVQDGNLEADVGWGKFFN